MILLMVFLSELLTLRPIVPAGRENKNEPLCRRSMENEKNALSVIIDSAPQRIVTVYWMFSSNPERGNRRFPDSSAVFPFLPDACLALSDGTLENRASISAIHFGRILAHCFNTVNG